MISTLVFYLLRLAYVFGLSSVCYASFKIASQIWRKEYVVMPPDSMILRRRSEDVNAMGVNHVWQVAMTCLVRASVLTCVFIIGYATRDLQSYRRTADPRANDLIIDRHTDVSYRMLSASGMEFESDLCPDSIPVDWQVGNKFELWRYEQKSDCKRVIWYKAYTNPTTGARLMFDVPQSSRKEVADNVSDGARRQR